jgi:hypothetical protein
MGRSRFDLLRLASGTQCEAVDGAQRLTGFMFNIKPFAQMTQHPGEISRLPKALRELLPAGGAVASLRGPRRRSSIRRSRCSGAQWRRYGKLVSLESWPSSFHRISARSL